MCDEPIKLNESDSETVRNALMILHREVPSYRPEPETWEWTINVGPVVYSPDDFVPFRCVKVNGCILKMRSEVKPQEPVL